MVSSAGPPDGRPSTGQPANRGPDAGLQDDGRYGRRDIPGIAAVIQGCALWTLAWD